jgi:hypothetical protein
VAVVVVMAKPDSWPSCARDGIISRFSANEPS